MKLEIMPAVRRFTKVETVSLFVMLAVISCALVGTIIATKAPCSWKPAWRPECKLDAELAKESR